MSTISTRVLCLLICSCTYACEKNNPDVCCTTADDCKAIGFDHPIVHA